MQPLKARIQNGRIQLDEPTDLPDGDVYLVPVDDLTESERTELELGLAEALADVREGRVADLADVLTKAARGTARRFGSLSALSVRSNESTIASELVNAVDLLRDNPELGIHYKTQAGDVVRRILLRRSDFHVYYAITGRDVVILIVWGARRERDPKR